MEKSLTPGETLTLATCRRAEWQRKLQHADWGTRTKQVVKVQLIALILQGWWYFHKCFWCDLICLYLFSHICDLQEYVQYKKKGAH